MRKRILLAAGVFVIVAAAAWLISTRDPKVNASAKPGELRWKANLGLYAHSPVALNDVVVAYGFSIWSFGKQKLYACNTATGKSLWAKDMREMEHFVGAGSSAFIPYGDDYERRQVFDLLTGQLRLGIPKTAPQGQVFAIASDRVYICSSHRIMAFSLTHKAIEWTYEVPTGRGIHQDVVIDGTRAYFRDFDMAGDDNKFTAVNLADGKEAWSVSMGKEYAFNAAAGDGAVCYSTMTSGFHVLDAATGVEKWQLPPAIAWWRCPVIAGGRLYLADAGRCVAYSITDGKVIWRYTWPSMSRIASISVRGDSVYCGAAGAFIVLDADTGIERWRFQTAGNVTWPPALSPNTVYVTTDNGWLYAVATEPEEKADTSGK